ncbi:4,5-DOPA-extradiol-dioxygenase [Elizabethkingia anophelis]|uniref:4,5-DOPA dioxygenase extradiol n=1 Tax=Elizabethkingia anophelis TaxID=1117645 RepID=A0AAE4P1A3_9FLAO|nr:4,5-DOPA dioxygenase extradiol [Elizabethkingia anophelis]MDV3663663.1 4,5-DOPA dioxygenase extradiol [Elizabethkingia anophelis]
MELNHLKSFTNGLPNTEKMPVLFLGHGSPMNAIEENDFVSGWRKIGQSIPKPTAIICISAHWETSGTKVTATPHPKTIHDFYGFPPELFAVQYPAPGSPELAAELSEVIDITSVGLDKMWGLDHGAWSVIKFLYPDADVPVIEFSIDIHKSPKEHYELAKELQYLRHKGVLIVGSGNIVHNLRMMNWHQPETGYDWAIEANDTFKNYLLQDKQEELLKFQGISSANQLSVPTPEHYIPSLYAYALRDNNDSIKLFNDQLIYGSIGMLSFQIG